MKCQITFDGQPDGDFEKFKAKTEADAQEFVRRRQEIVDTNPAATHKPVIGYMRLGKKGGG